MIAWAHRSSLPMPQEVARLRRRELRQACSGSPSLVADDDSWARPREEAQSDDCTSPTTPSHKRRGMDRVPTWLVAQRCSSGPAGTAFGLEKFAVRSAIVHAAFSAATR